MAIINDNDMEFILKGTEERAIRQIIKDRLFVLVRMPAEKPKMYNTACTSSVFVGDINGFTGVSFAIRETDSKTRYENCEYYLCLYHRRGTDSESKEYFNKSLERKRKMFSEVQQLPEDDLISFVRDKELVIITNYFEEHGDMEQVKLEHFLDNCLLLRESPEKKYFLRDDFYDVKIFLCRTEDDDSPKGHRLCHENIHNFGITKKLIGCIEKNSQRYYDDYLNMEYESKSEDIQAVYFTTMFHSNRLWNADPICLLNFRFSVFILPGIMPAEEVKAVPESKKVKNTVSGETYIIDSIHFNSDICFDFSEWEEMIDGHFEDIDME